MNKRKLLGWVLLVVPFSLILVAQVLRHGLLAVLLTLGLIAMTLTGLVLLGDTR